jgi:AcrR family transcriptional regulator
MSPADTVPPPTDRSTRILEAACRVIVREGAHGLRMARVAEEADVSKALVHYYFATRQELLRSAFAFSEQRWLAAIDAELATVSAGAARVERMLLVSVDPALAFSEQRALGNEVWSSLRSDEELRPVVERSYRAWLGRVVDLIEEGKADGSIAANVDATSTGWRLAAAADGFDSLLYLGLVDRDDAVRLMRETITRELSEPSH